MTQLEMKYTFSLKLANKLAKILKQNKDFLNISYNACLKKAFKLCHNYFSKENFSSEICQYLFQRNLDKKTQKVQDKKSQKAQENTQLSFAF